MHRFASLHNTKCHFTVYLTLRCADKHDKQNLTDIEDVIEYYY